MADARTDAELTDILGPKCPDCGWRRGLHRPWSEQFEACPQWTSGAEVPDRD
jgi:hypothetical protein